MKHSVANGLVTAGPQTDRQDELVARGRKLLLEKQYREAEFCIQSVLFKNPRHADALNLMGLLSLVAEKFQISVDYHRKAVRLNPRDAIFQNNLGHALLQAEAPIDSMAHLKKAMTLDRNYAEPAFNLGKAHMALGNIAKSRRFFEKALKIDPDYHLARAALAELAFQTGELEEAATRFEQILQKYPQNVGAMAFLSMSRKIRPEDPKIRLIENHLKDPNTEREQRVILHHAMGKISNDIGEYDKAIYHFALGKQEANLFFDLELHRRRYAMLRNTFTREFFAARRGFGIDDERPVFIVGMPRSGTTLTEQIIASHPLVHGLGERTNIGEIGRQLKFGERESYLFSENVSGLEPRGVKNFARQYLKLYEDASRGSARVSDKNPHNTEMLGLIALLYPNARIIHCRRDPMDTCVSCYMQNFDKSHGYNADLATIGHYYVEYDRLMDHWRKVLPLRMFELQYEDMVADQEGMSRKLIDFLGLQWDDVCLNYFETKRIVVTPSLWQVRQPIYQSSVGRWKRYDRHLEPLKSALGDLFAEDT